MRYRVALSAVLLSLAIVMILSGCQLWPWEMTPTAPAPITSATVERPPLPPTSATIAPVASAVVSPEFISPGGPTVVPILYKMFDWGTDFQKEHPEWGPVGSIQFVLWETINPGPDQYNWAAIDQQLAKEAPLKVTLPDGREIQKPVVIQVMAHISSYPGWDAAQYYDATPGWVYDQIQASGETIPTVGGRRVGHVLEGCDSKAVLPRYDSLIWQQAYLKMIRAFGARYNKNPQVTSTVINTGLDGETQPVKDLTCTWNTFLDKQASKVRYNFGKFIDEAMAVHREAFPDKVIYINHAPAGSGGRKAIADKAATFNPPIGLKHAGMWVDLDSHQGYGDFVGSWDMVRAYSMTLPIWLESPFGLGGKEQRYWSLIAGLHYHPDAIDLHPEYFAQSDPEWLDFTVRHLGVTIDNTPSVWTVLRDTEYPLQDWGKGGVSGHMGDWTFWLNRTEKSGQSATVVVERDKMPAAKEHVFSRQTRKTQQSKNQLYMDFDIDDKYPYVNQKPIDNGGDVYYRVHVTILNMGNDTFALQYRDLNGRLVSQVRSKGPSLGPTNDWVRVTFTVRDGFWNNNMPGGNDFRISCEGDGDEYIHMVQVEGGFGAPPTLTPTPRETRTPRETPTSSKTPKPEAAIPPAGTPTPLPGAVRFDPMADTVLDQWAPDTSAMVADKLQVRQGDIKVPLLAFDVSAIPQDAQIEKAILSLYIVSRSNTGEMNLTAHKLLRAWNAAEANWTIARKGQPWAVAGCKDPQQDRSSVAVAKALLRLDKVWYDLDLTALLRDWVNNGSLNAGLLLAGSGTTSVQYDIASMEYYDKNVRPRLWVVYHQPEPQTPTATSAPSETPTMTAEATATPSLPPASPSPTQPTTEPGASPSIEPPEEATTSPTATETPSPTPTPSATPSPTQTRTVLPTPTILRLREGDRYEGMVDTYLDAWAEDKNYSQDIKMAARQGSVRVPLLRFDLTSIPPYASVKRAVLHLYSTARSNSSSLQMSVAKVSRFWDPGQVTWRQTTASEAWAQAGARDAITDRSRELYSSALVDAERRWMEWDVTKLAQEWVADPQGNYGLLMLAEGSVSVQYDFTTAQWYPEEYRPYLEIEFIAAQPSPTPSGQPALGPTVTPTLSLTPSLTPLPAAAQYAFQQGVNGYAGCADTTIDSWNPQTNYGADSRLILRQGNTRAVLARFDVSSIPRYSRIGQALLQVYVKSRSRDSNLPIEVRGLLRPWAANESTYERASKSEAWLGAGASGQGQDISATPVAQKTLQAIGQWEAFDLTALVQDWVNDPLRNHGVIIRAGGQVSVEYILVSSDSKEDPELRPRLQVNWEAAPATATPEPTATTTATSMATTTEVAATPTSEELAPTPGVEATLSPSFEATTPTTELTPTHTPLPAETATPEPGATPIGPTAEASATLTATLETTSTPAQTPEEGASPTPTRTYDIAQVEKLVLQQGLGGYEGVDDTYLDAWFQTDNMGEQTTLSVRQNNIRSSLLRYDLRSIPQDAAIREATLNLWVHEVSGQGPMCIQVYMIRRPWREDVATWLEADLGVSWADGGAGGAALDYEERLVEDASFDSAQQWLSIDIAPAVQYWVRHPEANFGLVIKGVGSTSGESRFASSQWETRQQRPRMLLTYERAPSQAHSAWIRLLQKMNPLQWLGIITSVVAVLLLLVAAGIPSKVRSRR